VRDAGGTAVARAEGGRLQPLCALYRPEALATLESAPPGEPLTRTVERLGPVIVDVPPAWLRNVNTREDLR
jgi:molybdopterin-guanine dinucleotide biosynthesis protein A